MKTVPSSVDQNDVEVFLDGIPDDRRRADARTVCDLMARVTGEPPTLWGDSIVGFGTRHLRYASGRELDWMVVGFSPRKAATVVYLTDGFENRREVLERLGPHSIGKSCLNLKRLDRVDLAVLEELIRDSVASVRAG